MELTLNAGQESRDRNLTLSPLKAIRFACLQCSNYSLTEVRHCPISHCALWPYRFGKRPQTRYTIQIPAQTGPTREPSCRFYAMCLEQAVEENTSFDCGQCRRYWFESMDEREQMGLLMLAWEILSEKK